MTRNPKRPDIDSERQLTAAMREGFSFSSAPGTRFEYSNLGYALLGQIVQRVSGKNLRDYVNAEILLPLGMNSTYWQAADAPPHAEPAPSAALVAARDGVTQLLQQWDDALVQRTFVSARPTPRNLRSGGPDSGPSGGAASLRSGCPGCDEQPAANGVNESTMAKVRKRTIGVHPNSGSSAGKEVRGQRTRANDSGRDR